MADFNIKNKLLCYMYAKLFYFLWHIKLLQKEAVAWKSSGFKLGLVVYRAKINML